MTDQTEKNGSASFTKSDKRGSSVYKKGAEFSKSADLKKTDNTASTRSSSFETPPTASDGEGQGSRIQAINALLTKKLAPPRGKERSVDKQKPDERGPFLSLNLFFAILIMAEVLVISASSSGILNLVRSTVDVNRKFPDFLWLAAVSVVLGILTIIFLTRFLSAPISTLGGAVQKIAKGDFSIRLRTDRGFKELRKINESFNTMAKELEATEILQTNFVSNVSHEFKTPITAIEGYATLLGDSEGTTPQQKEYIEKILLNTGRLSTLVGNILLLSKIDNQGIPTKKTRFRLDEQIRQSIVELEPKWSAKDTDFDVEMDEIVYEGNEALLFHVWNNLIENAIKFGPVGGVIEITLHAEGNKIIFTIADEGDGIPDEAKNHIFDRFYQSEGSHKNEGNGLGLALVKQIIDTEGGAVSVSDGRRRGAFFTVELN